jgi:hypothetical protein
MADQPTTPSGSRWEPDPDETPTTAGADVPAGEPPASDAPDPYGVPSAEPIDDAAERRAQLRGRAILAGAATALTLGGGLTGFVIGHSTAGDDAGFRPAGNIQRDGSGPQLGEGQQGPPSFPGGDRDGDQDGDGFGPPHGFDGGSSSSGSGGTDGTGSSGTGT